MLIQLRVENFLSVKEEITFSMLASPDASLGHNVITEEFLKKDKLLKSAAIYGANASGKTNVLQSLNFMRLFVTENLKIQQGDPIDITPFTLDDNYLKKPSSFEIILILAGVKYVYGFIVDEKRVHEEYLYHYPHGKQAVIFERSNTNEYRFTKDVEEQKALAARTLDNRLYLVTATNWKYQPTKPVFEWFKNNIKVRLSQRSGHWRNYTARGILGNKKMRQFAVEFLKGADFGIDDVDVSVESVKPDDMPKELFDFLQQALQEKNVDLEKDLKNIKIALHHAGIDVEGNPKSVPLPFEDESAGTQKMFELLGPWFHILAEGYLLVIDELEASLHPELCKALVTLFHNPKYNKKHAQLIFTTHNTNLLHLTILRRDQIWFTQKRKNEGSTDLYSLVDLRRRKDENIEKGYLAGRYGGVPHVDVDFLFLEETE